MTTTTSSGGMPDFAALVQHALGRCTCLNAFQGRGLVDPECVACGYGAETEVALRIAFNAGREQAQQWRPISEAPRDGTPVDVWTGNDEFPARWTDAYFGKPHHQCNSEYCDSCPEDMNVNAWRDPMGGYQIGKPTHFMLRPPPPTKDTP